MLYKLQKADRPVVANGLCLTAATRPLLWGATLICADQG